LNAESDRVQTLRGVACILLVAYHVIGDGLSRGLGVDDTSPYRIFSNIFLHLRMPLFTFLSGFVYAYRPVLAGSSSTFARKKLQRLLIPLLVVSTIYFIVQQLVPDTNTKQPWDTIWRIYVFPYNHFWFLQAIILIFSATLVLEMRGWLRSFGSYLAVLCVVLAIHFTARMEHNVFSIQQATYLAPFFLAGLGANRFHARFWDRRLQFTMLATFLITFSIHALGCLHVYGVPLEQRTLLATALSLSGILTLMYWTPSNAVLGWLGGFSFTIYLYHVFFTAGARIVLNRLGVHDLNLHVLLGCALGVIGPVLFELGMRRSGLARRLLLGQS
jgi:glucan biosynthesis protein C